MENKRVKRVEKKLINKKAQLTIFIILAIVIVAAALAIYLLFPGVVESVTGVEFDSESYMKKCVEPDVKKAVELIASQGGSRNPENYILYQSNKIEYLCYTTQYYQTCVMQQPLLKQHIETEIEREIREKLRDCVSSLKNELEKRGYAVSSSPGSVSVEIVPDNIVVNLGTDLTISKADVTKQYKKFKISVSSQMYNLVMISTSILNWEARYGDSESTVYMSFYPSVKVEKLKQSDGSTIYILTHRNTNEKFQFASRSLAWPAGYGFGT